MIMKEKKLPDEEIVKAFEHCCYKARDYGCGNCAYCYTVGDDIRCNMKKMRCDTLDLIRRLQERVFDYENLEKHAKKLELENIEQKAEIERLTEENGYLDGCAKQFLADYQKCEIERAELQKQVDELKEENEKLRYLADECMKWRREYCNTNAIGVEVDE